MVTLAGVFNWSSTWPDQKDWSRNRLKLNGGLNQTYWNKNNGPNFLDQNVWFFRCFPGIQIKRFCVGKNLVQVSSTKFQKPRSNKNCGLWILLSQKCNWRFIHVFLRSKDDINHWTKKSQQVEGSKNVFSISI